MHTISYGSLMPHDCKQIWRSEEYQLFPIGMDSAEGNFSFVLVFFRFDIEAAESVFLA